MHRGDQSPWTSVETRTPCIGYVALLGAALISFAVGRNGAVSLVLYDQQSRVVRTLGTVDAEPDMTYDGRVQLDELFSIIERARFREHPSSFSF